MEQPVCAFHTTEYDKKIRRTLPYYEEFYQQVIDVVRMHHSGSVSWLDVGCGTGRMAEVAFGNISIEKFVFCDCSEEMIEEAKKRFTVPNAEFLVMPVQTMEFQDAFDVMTAIQVNHYLQKEERKAAIQNSYRALKKNGIFITFENFAPSSELGEQLYLKRWKDYQLRQGGSREDCEKHIARYKHDYFPISVSEHVKLMEACGFRAVEILWLSYMQVGLLGIK